VLYRLAGLIAALYALTLFYMLVVPLVELSGIISGYVSLTRYHLTYYGSTVALPSLDAVRALSLLVAAEALLLLFAGIYAMIGRNRWVAWELLLSALLVVLMIAPLTFVLLRIVDVETANLAISHVRYTSAGYMNFGTTTFTSLHLPTVRLAYIAVTAIYLLATIAATIYLARKEATKPSTETRG